MVKLTEENYYSDRANSEYMSYSQYKDFCKCPAYAMAKITGRWADEETDSLLVGSYVDAWLDGGIEKFKSEHPQIFNSRTGELKSDYRQADELCRKIKEDEYLYGLLTGERQKIMTCKIAGVPFKVKIDSLLEDCIVDGKVLKDCRDAWIDEYGCYKPFIYINRYDLQGYIYSTAVKQNTGKKLPFKLAVITKEKVPDKRVFVLSEETLESAGQEIIRNAPIFQKMKEGTERVYGCGKCEYCRSLKKLNKDMEEEI